MQSYMNRENYLASFKSKEDIIDTLKYLKRRCEEKRKEKDSFMFQIYDLKIKDLEGLLKKTEMSRTQISQNEFNK